MVMTNVTEVKLQTHRVKENIYHYSIVIQERRAFYQVAMLHSRFSFNAKDIAGNLADTKEALTEVLARVRFFIILFIFSYPSVMSRHHYYMTLIYQKYSNNITLTLVLCQFGESSLYVR